MSKQYCFDIENPDNVNFDPNALKEHVRGLYMGRGVDKFSKDDPPPFIMLFVSTFDGKNVCIRLTTRGRKNIERIENINKKITAAKLNWNGLELSKPYEWGTAQQSWWDTEQSKTPGERWVSIVQRGPYFTHLEDPYQPLGGKLMYGGRMYDLTPQEEKVAMLYAKRLVSEEAGGVVDHLTKDKVFNKNFWTDFKTYLTPDHQRVFKDFNKIGWRDLTKKVNLLKEYKPSKEEKRAKLIRNEEKKRQYGWARLDGNLEQVGNFTVEPVGLFMGRGKNPLRGRVKKEVNPEDVTINVGVDDPIPAPPAGHRWKKVIHDQTVGWLAKWKDSITGDVKYVQFAATGKFKGKSDLAKYEKARKLQRHIDTVRETYMADAASTNDEKMQLGTVLWLIDNHGIRPGDERTEDQADTVGASTLRVGHVKLLPGDKIKFEFLGKDSIKFEKSMEVPSLIYANFKRLVSGRSKNAQVFNLISAGSINAYLKQFDAQFSNKVFRTRLASHIMFEALKEVSIPKDATKKTTKLLFNKANVKVADVLNHTRSISMNAQKALKKLQVQLKELKDKLKSAKKEGKSAKSIAALKKRIAGKQDSIEAKEDTKSVAINTSLTNYIDPRIVVAWAKVQAAKGKKSEFDENTNKLLKDVYSTAMLKKFEWAVQSPYVTKDWNWLTSPLQGPSELQPGEARPSGKPKSRPPPVSSEPGVTKKEARAWCRRKYGTDWYKTDKKARLKEAKEALAEDALPEPPSPEPPSPEPPSPEPPSPAKHLEDYKLLLRACKSGFRDIRGLQTLYRVRKEGGYVYPALEWLHPFTLYAVEKDKGVVKVSKKFNKLYDLFTKTSSSGLSPREAGVHPHLEHLKWGRG
jgi:DNA topoisomerase-1